MKARQRTRGVHDAAATREALLAAGGAVFAERGFEGARVDQIARRARVNKAMINYHFGGKKGLYRAVLTASFPPLAEGLARLESEDRPAEDRLREFIAAFAQLHASQPTLPVMLLRELLAGGHRLDDSVVQSFLHVFDRLHQLLAKGEREGAFRPVDPFLAHLGLVGSLVFFFATTAFRQRLQSEGKLAFPAAPEDYVRHLQELAVRGLRAEPTVRPPLAQGDPA